MQFGCHPKACDHVDLVLHIGRGKTSELHGELHGDAAALFRFLEITTLQCHQPLSFPYLQVVQAVEALEETRTMLFDLQSDAGLSRWNDSLLVDLRLAGLVEAWAAGATWTQVRDRPLVVLLSA